MREVHVQRDGEMKKGAAVGNFCSRKVKDIRIAYNSIPYWGDGHSLVPHFFKGVDMLHALAMIGYVRVHIIAGHAVKSITRRNAFNQ